MSGARTRAERGSAPSQADAETAKQVLEALLFVADEPVTLDQIGVVLPNLSRDDLRGLVESVDSGLRAGESALRIEEIAGGYRLATRPELAPWIRAFFRTRNRARLSSASVETLAVIAYKQPVTAPEIQEIRGVDPQGSIKSLLEKGLIRIAGKKKVIGRPFLYSTSREFLIHFGLPSIDDLPPIEDFERLASALGTLPGGGASDAEVDSVTGPGAEADARGGAGEGPWEDETWGRAETEQAATSSHGNGNVEEE